MGAPRTPPPVQFFCGVIFSDIVEPENVRIALGQRFGAIDGHSGIFEFNLTNYYEKEMGAGLKKIFFAFEELKPPEFLVECKLATNELEHSGEWARGDGRVVNLDPGYVAELQMVLATTKDSGHRVYLGGGIHAEATLAYINKSFRPWQWTYPDYRTDAYIEYFNGLRKEYIKKLRSGLYE